MNIRDNIIQASIKVAYDQPHDYISISQGHKGIKYLTQALNKQVHPKAREIKSKTHSLEAYDLYIFLPLWQQVTKKFKYA